MDLNLKHEMYQTIYGTFLMINPKMVHKEKSRLIVDVDGISKLMEFAFGKTQMTINFYQERNSDQLKIRTLTDNYSPEFTERIINLYRDFRDSHINHLPIGKNKFRLNYENK